MISYVMARFQRTSYILRANKKYNILCSTVASAARSQTSWFFWPRRILTKLQACIIILIHCANPDSQRTTCCIHMSSMLSERAKTDLHARHHKQIIRLFLIRQLINWKHVIIREFSCVTTSCLQYRSTWYKFYIFGERTASATRPDGCGSLFHKIVKSDRDNLYRLNQ